MFHDIVCIVINTNVLNMNYVYSTLSHVCKLTNNLIKNNGIAPETYFNITLNNLNLNSSIVQYDCIRNTLLQIEITTNLRSYMNMLYLLNIKNNICSLVMYISDYSLVPTHIISEFKNLKYLEFNVHDNRTPLDLSFLSTTTINHIRLDNIRVSETNLIDISNMQNLESLHLPRCVFETNLSTIYINNMQNITSLNLENTIINDDLKYISNLNNLRYLNLDNCDIADENIVYLNNMGLLTELVINQYMTPSINLPQSITHLTLTFVMCDDDLKHLTNLVNLEYLILNDCTQITNECCAHLCNLVNMHTIKFQYTNITSECFKYFVKMDKLSIIDLTQCTVYEDDFKYLRPNLNTLVFGYCNLSALGCSMLKTLNIKNIFIQ